MFYRNYYLTIFAKKKKNLVKNMKVFVTIFSVKFGLSIRNDYLFAK